MAATSLLSLANMFWLGRLGATAQATVTLAGIPVMLLLSLMPIISVGSGILVAQAVGGRDRMRANAIFNEAFGCSLLLVSTIGAIIWLGRDAFGAWLSADPEVAGSIARYACWLVPSLFVQVPIFVLSGALDFTGNVRVGVLAQSCMLVLNAAFTPIFVFGWLGAPRLDVEGAAFATFAAGTLVMAGLVVYSMRGGSYLTFAPRSWLSRPALLGDALRIGLPVGIEGAVATTYLLVIATLLRSFGQDQQAAFGIGQRVFQAVLIPLLALSSATSVLAGQNHGAQREDRVRETLRMSLTIGLFAAPLLIVVIEVFAPAIGKLFSDDVTVTAMTATFLRIIALGLVPLAGAYAVFAVLAGTGNTRSSLHAQLTCAALIVSASAMASRLPGFESSRLWWILVAGNGAQALLAWHFARRRFGGDTRPLIASPAGDTTS
ncbi:MAG TPA: MATE family efflux transporter [Kofleriaceae bacterium]|nr:MATE family efflux transporter [Kofleriaceae bacterium]